MFSRWRRQRALKKVKPGDGRRLRTFHWWHGLWRTRFVGTYAAPGEEPHEYTVEVSYFDLEGRVELYRDGVQHATATAPAVFPVPGGVIDVAMSTFGMKRVHLVLDSGGEHQLRAAPRTMEHGRAVLHRRHPTLSRWIARTAIAVLLVGLVLVVPQLLERVTTIPEVAERVGTFTSPISMPSWLNLTLGLAGVAAGLERALTLRNHWLIDADTWMLGG